MKPLDFAHALLKRRLTDAYINTEFVNTHGLGNRSAVPLTEPLHAQTAERLIEAVENLARTIIYTSNGRRGRIECTPIVIGSSDIKMVVLKFEEMK